MWKRYWKTVCILCAAGLCVWAGHVQAYIVNTYDGVELKWPSSSLPLVYLINENGTPDCEGEFDALHAAYAEWQAVSNSSMEFSFGGLTSSTDWGAADGVNLSIWIESDWSDRTETGSGTIGLNRIWFYADGRIIDSDIAYNGQNQGWSSTGQSGKMDVRNIATHEIGHSLSLSDLYNGTDSDKTMYGYASAGETKKRTLHEDDMAGIAHLYPGSGSSDYQAPTMEAIVESEGQYYNRPPVFDNFGFDDDQGLDDGWYQIDSCSGSWTKLFENVSGASWNQDGWELPQFYELDEASHTIYFKMDDDAGNVNGKNGELAWQFLKDTTCPPAPADLRAEPSGWSNSNSYSLTWTDPGDDSGISGWYYKLGNPPQSPTDGSFSTAKPLVIILPLEGIHDLYLWFEDNAGNGDSENAALTLLRLDETYPILGTMTIENGGEITEELTVTLTDLGAADELSGVGWMQFSNDGEWWTDAEPIDTVRPAWDLGAFGGTSENGQKTVFVRYVDDAGNVSETCSDDIIYTPPLKVTTQALNAAVINRQYSDRLEASGGEGSYLWSIVGGSLPEGLDLHVSGVIEGFPAADEPCVNTFTVEVSDAASTIDRRELSLDVCLQQRGDANGDGLVDILDAIVVVNMVLGDSCRSMEEDGCWAADRDGNGIVNILDVLSIVNAVLGGAGLKAGNFSLSSVSVCLNEQYPPSVDSNPILVMVSSDVSLGGLQATLKIMDPCLNFGDPELSERSRDMDIAFEKEDRTLTICLYSLSGRSITPGSGPVCFVPVLGNSDGACQSMKSIVIDDLVVGDATGSGLPVDRYMSLLTSENGREKRVVEMGENYPNPFNTDTTIPFTVNAPCRVTMSMYNVLGQKTDLLLDGYLDPGNYHADWSGSSTASGYYFCRIEAQGVTLVRPVLMLK